MDEEVVEDADEIVVEDMDEDVVEDVAEDVQDVAVRESPLPFQMTFK